MHIAPIESLLETVCVADRKAQKQNLNPFWKSMFRVARLAQILEHLARILEHLAQILGHLARILEHLAQILEHLARILEYDCDCKFAGKTGIVISFDKTTVNAGEPLASLPTLSVHEPLFMNKYDEQRVYHESHSPPSRHCQYTSPY